MDAVRLPPPVRFLVTRRRNTGSPKSFWLRCESTFDILTPKPRKQKYRALGTSRKGKPSKGSSPKVAKHAG